MCVVTVVDLDDYSFCHMTQNPYKDSRLYMLNQSNVYIHVP